MPETPRIKDTYLITTVCSNCGHCGETRIPKGEPAIRYFDHETSQCPNCGCSTLRRAW
jgi:hypothetical protein